MRGLRDTTTPAQRKGSTTGQSRYARAARPSWSNVGRKGISLKVGKRWLASAVTSSSREDFSRTLPPHKFAAGGFISSVSIPNGDGPSGAKIP